MSASGHERSIDTAKISPCFCSSLLADTVNEIFIANSLVLAIKPAVKERNHGKFKQLSPIANNTSPLEQR